jgi:hypothetical protein
LERSKKLTHSQEALDEYFGGMDRLKGNSEWPVN